MKCLSIQQPWAMLIVAGIKDVENRTWSTSYRGPLAIHAGKALNFGACQETLEDLTDNEFRALGTAAAVCLGKFASIRTLPRGAIIGVVDLVGMMAGGSESRWANNQPGTFHWVMRNPRPIPKVLMRGALGLFDVSDERVAA